MKAIAGFNPDEIKKAAEEIRKKKPEFKQCLNYVEKF